MYDKNFPFALVFSQPVPEVYRNRAEQPFDAVSAAGELFVVPEGDYRRPAVLIVAATGDAVADTVGAELVRRGVATSRFRPDTLNRGSALAFWSDEQGVRGELLLPFGAVSLDAVRSVFFRWRRTGGAPAGSGVESFRRSESAAALEGLESVLHESFWLDWPTALSASGSKLEHLRRAATLGFAVPRTLVTNRSDTARSFLRTCSSAVVKAFSWLWDGDAGRRVIYTHRLRPEDEAWLNLVDNTPCIFQEEVPRRVELRVTVVGGQVFAAAIRAENPGELVDWRDLSLGLRYQPRELPDEVRERCLRLARESGVRFATLDLIETPSGEHVFLDFNVLGNWLHVEGATGLPITAAVADLLESAGAER